MAAVGAWQPIPNHGAQPRGDLFSVALGAHDGPDSWLTAFETHQAQIERQALELYMKVGRPSFVVIFEPARQGAG